jgi:hypothetical protein
LRGLKASLPIVEQHGNVARTGVAGDDIQQSVAIYFSLCDPRRSSRAGPAC